MNTAIAAAIGGASALNAKKADTRPQAVTEARQETQIWTAYALNPYLRPYGLRVSVSEGIATVRGTVADEPTKDLALQIALGVDGIRSVDSRVDVVPQFVPPADSGDRAFGELVDDTTVTSAVRSKLAWSRYANGMRAHVASSGGRVMLTGWVTSAEGKEGAAKLALSTHGVHSVSNELEIQPGVVTPIGAELADSWITVKVKSTFLYSTHVAGRDIGVETLGGIVSLTGHIDSEADRTLAIELAGNVRGVKGIESAGLTLTG
jgi:hyperosmotically inducible periplasmic protein